MLGRCVLWLLALVVAMNSWYVVESVKRKGRTGHISDTRISLTQCATIVHFLEKMEKARPAVNNNGPRTTNETVVVTVHSGMHGVRVNFLGNTVEYSQNHECRSRISYRMRYGRETTDSDKGGMIVQDELSTELELFNPSDSTQRVYWRMYGSVHEKDLVKDNPQLHLFVQERDDSYGNKHKIGRLYTLQVSLCLKLARPTHCHIYWHPLDGIIILALDSISNTAIMAQADWSTIITTAQQLNSSPCVYRIKVKAFKKAKKASIQHFINLLTSMAQQFRPTLPQGSSSMQSLMLASTNTSKCGELWGSSNLKDNGCAKANEEDKHMSLRNMTSLTNLENHKDLNMEEKTNKHSIYYVMN